MVVIGGGSVDVGKIDNVVVDNDVDDANNIVVDSDVDDVDKVVVDSEDADSDNDVDSVIGVGSGGARGAMAPPILAIYLRQA